MGAGVPGRARRPTAGVGTGQRLGPVPAQPARPPAGSSPRGSQSRQSLRSGLRVAHDRCTVPVGGGSPGRRPGSGCALASARAATCSARRWSGRWSGKSGIAHGFACLGVAAVVRGLCGVLSGTLPAGEAPPSARRRPAAQGGACPCPGRGRGRI